MRFPRERSRAFPLVQQTILLNTLLQPLEIDLPMGDQEHSGDVPQMLFRPAFPILLQLPEDDVFNGGDPDGFTFVPRRPQTLRFRSQGPDQEQPTSGGMAV